MTSTPSTRRQLDGVAVWSFTARAPDLLIDLRTGELGPVGARISDGEDRIPTYLHGFTATCGVLVDTGSGGEAGGADEGEA